MNNELKPVQCGCGGRAEINHYIADIWYEPEERYVISCAKCHISTDACFTEIEAITAWNKAMNERTTRVECIAEVYKDEIVDHYLSGICGICGENTYDHAKYCFNCGAKLDWSWNE